MRNSADSFPKIGYRHLFGRPALEKQGECATRRERIERKAIATLTEGERAYLEACELVEAYPGQLSEIIAGISDTERLTAEVER